MIPKLKILFVEDLPTDVELAKRALNKEGIIFEFAVVDTEKAFIKQIEEFQPDIIISDYSMPSFTGMRALKITLEKSPITPFIILTGSMNEEVAVLCLKTGASDYIIKEHLTRLPFALKEALEKKKIRLEILNADKALRESEERFRSVTQSANDAIITSDSRGKILEWNKGAERIFGYTEAELIGKELSVIIPNQHRQHHQMYMKRIEEGEAHRIIGRTVELSGIKKSGVEFPLELSLAEWVSSNGKFYSAIIRDITERKRSELESQVLYEITKAVTITSKLDEFLTQMHFALQRAIYADNIFVALYDYKTKLFNFPYFVDEYDSPPSPASLDKSCTAYVFRTGNILLLTPELFKQLSKQGEVELVGSPSPSWLGIPLHTPSMIIGVLVLQHYDKENIFNELDQKFLNSIGSQVALAIERKISEDELIKAKEKAEESDKLKSEFLHQMSHEMRSPMNAVLSFSNLLKEEIIDNLTPNLIEYFDGIESAGRRLIRTVELILNTSEMQVGSYEPLVCQFDLQKEVIEKIIYENKKMIKEKGLNFDFSSTLSELMITGDHYSIHQIFLNLIDNSIKFTKRGSISINVSKKDEGIIVCIEDTGIGMSEEFLSHMYRPFIQEESGYSRRFEGNGLGLSLVKKYCDLNGIDISVESKKKIGTKFTLFFHRQNN